MALERRERRGRGSDASTSSKKKRKRVREEKKPDEALLKILTGGDGDDEQNTSVVATEGKGEKASVAGKVPTSSTKKRQRVPEDMRSEEGDALLKLLTGADDGDTSDDAQDAQQRPQPQHQQQQKSPAPTAGAGAATATAAAAAPAEAASEAWMRPLSAAHAKKVNVTVLLERANLENVKQSAREGGSVLLNCDDHKHILRKTNRDANDARPDITHQCLLTLLDSPLNKAGRLKVYIRTAKNVLIEVHAQTRIPRTMRRFSGLMAELLDKFKVRGTVGSTPLLKVIRNPITSHLPVGTRKVVCTYNTDNVVDVRHHAHQLAALALQGEKIRDKQHPSEQQIDELADDVHILYVVGAMAHGKVVEDWADESICVSEYPLSAATVCSRITYAYESLLAIM